MKEKKSRNRLEWECYKAFKENKSVRRFSKVVRDAAIERMKREFAEEYGQDAMDELQAEMDRDNMRMERATI